MRFNKILYISLLCTIWIVNTNGALINRPNPRLGFSSGSHSVANSLYSALEWPLATFPHEQIKEEVDTMKLKILKQSRKQYENLQPNAEFGYVLKKRPKKRNRNKLNIR